MQQITIFMQAITDLLIGTGKQY